MGENSEWADGVIRHLMNCETIKTDYGGLHWILLTADRRNLKFDLNFTVKISGEEITLTGIKDE